MTHVIKDIQSDSWGSINWAKYHRIVNNLQRRIFVAKQERRFRRMRKLQNLLLSSQANRCLAVKQIRFLNTRRHVGIDPGILLTPSTGIQLIHELSQIDLKHWKPEQAMWISSKPNKKNQPCATLKDIALQIMVKNALEPEWKVVFDESYAFRRRSPHDALSKISNTLRRKQHGIKRKNWILDADIEGFSNIFCHDYILSKLEHFPSKVLIEKWLKAGHIEKHGFHVSDLGKSGISPLLANIALHGVETELNTKPWGPVTWFALGRYANAIIGPCETKPQALITMEKLNHWLRLRGLQISNPKTKIRHITQGFDFLGFNIRMCLKKANKPKLLIKPSKACIVQLRKKLKITWKRVLGSTVSTVIAQLNPIIKQWANYYRLGGCSIHTSLDRYMWIRQYRYVKRTHPNKSYKWLKEKYWGQLCPNRKDKWVFGCKDTGSYMRKFAHRV